MQQENKKRRNNRGYYIALVLCLAAVGISGYVFVRTARDSAVETAAPAVISSAPAPRAVKPSAAKPTPAAKAEQETDAMEDSYEETMAEVPLEEPVMWPLEGEVVATFSQETLRYSQTMADWRTHEGLDIAAPEGTPVCAVQGGTVTAVYRDDFLGNVVVVSHDGDTATRYANLAEDVSVEEGQKVAAGETLGQVGKTALLETGETPHLHFEVYEKGMRTDPMDFLPEAEP